MRPARRRASCWISGCRVFPCRRLAWSWPARSTRAPSSAGAIPKRTLVRSERPNVNASTRTSSPSGTGRVLAGSSKSASTRVVHCANTRPSTAPARARSRLSVSSCRTRRARLAPSATRNVTSLWRRLALTRNRFATFAQAMSRTNTTAPMRRTRENDTRSRNVERPYAASSSRICCP